ncbi:heme-degrading domain-containing protein [Paenibacillus rhizovicinus]|uniref:Heme-degrading domain-containing protein n=1 Tax=Paenibacillus rhizovicinus TaxID=2704463 RepID=A0A6C0P1X9_9BACL|nr:heme-degrading domain-containing protein [Paenibacillus rhizovicinus]QHW32361.1 heme-degrading domain-containing protein [Paenibacillus rhizovicinus]
MSEFLEALLEQEEELQFESFTNEDAYELGCIIVKHAKDVLGKGIAVHIENGEYPLFTHYMTGTSKDNIYWVNAKKNVVHHYGHSSLYVGEMYKAQGTTFKEGSGLSLDEFQGEGGSFPIIVRGQGKVGTVTVSGLAGEEDHQVAVDGLRTYLTR